MMSTRTSIDEDGSGSGRRLPADLQRIHLGALEPAAAEELARTLLERGELGDVANASGIATEAAGHPMFIDELCRRAVQPAQVRSAPLRLDDALWERASALPPVVRRVLELIALAAAPLPQSVFQAAVQLDASDFRRSLSTLRLSAFVRSRGIRDDDLVEPYHDRVREAVAAHLSAKEQRSHHLLLAQALERAGLGTSRPELLLRHLEAGGDLERAARAAVDSARRAEESLAFDRAVDLYRTALRLSNLNADERQALQASLALALSRAGHAVLAAEQYLVASAGVDPTTRREQYTQAAEQFLIAGHVERGLAVIDELLGEVDERLPGTSRRALMSLLWQRARIRLRGFKWKQRHEREIAPSDLARLNVYQAIGEGLAAVDPIRGAAAQSRALVIALRLGEPKRVARALAMEAILLGMKGQGGQARAERVMARAKPIAARVSDPILSAIVLGADGYLRFAVGDFAAAAPIADAVDLRFRTSNVTSVFWQNNARLIGLIARRYRGEYTEQFKRFRELARDAERRGDLYMATSLRRVCSFLWLAMDRAAEASLDLDQSAWAAPAEGFHLQQWYELWARTECALYQGNALTAYDRLDPQFVALSRSLLLMVELVRVFAYWLRGRLALACAERAPEQRRFVRVARQCSRRLRKIKPEYAQIGAAGIEAAIARQAGDDRLAVRLLGEVSGRAEAAGIPLAAAAARHRLGEVVGGADGQQMVEEADRWMRNEGIRNADRMTDVIAPGFHVAKRLPPHVASDR
jgi:hypothetical protein